MTCRLLRCSGNAADGLEVPPGSIDDGYGGSTGQKSLEVRHYRIRLKDCGQGRRLRYSDAKLVIRSYPKLPHAVDARSDGANRRNPAVQQAGAKVEVCLAAR